MKNSGLGHIHLAVLAVGLLTACAAQNLDLQPADLAMTNAVQTATSDQDLAPSDLVSRIRGGFAVGTASSQGGVLGTFPCTETTASVLEALGFSPDQVKSVSYDRRSSGGGGDSGSSSNLTGYSGWVSFNDRRGHLVISLRPNCRYLNYYTRAGLELPQARSP